ncbi:MAG: ABC transporter permease subunit [Acidimicrobiales bacterium]|nr:ABC transporter permease subunit [Acidimicrobiales bacterium]
MNHPLAILASWEFRGAARSRWVLGTAVAFAALCLAVSLLGMRSLRDLGLTGVGPVSAGLINLGILLPAVMGLILGANALVAAREQGVLSVIASQPVSRASIVLGSFVGLVGALWTSVLLGFGAAAVVLSGVAKSSDVMPLVSLVAVSLGVSAACVALGLAMSAFANTRMQAVAAAITIWFLLALGMDLALAAIAPAVRMGPSGLLSMVVLNPLEAGRVLALLSVSPDGTVLGPFGSYLNERFGAGGAAGVLVAALVLWTAVPLILARWALVHRDV